MEFKGFVLDSEIEAAKKGETTHLRFFLSKASISSFKDRCKGARVIIPEGKEQTLSVEGLSWTCD